MFDKKTEQVEKNSPIDRYYFANSDYIFCQYTSEDNSKPFYNEPGVHTYYDTKDDKTVEERMLADLSNETVNEMKLRLEKAGGDKEFNTLYAYEREAKRVGITFDDLYLQRTLLSYVDENIQADLLVERSAASDGKTLKEVAEEKEYVLQATISNDVYDIAVYEIDRLKNPLVNGPFYGFDIDKNGMLENLKENDFVKDGDGFQALGRYADLDECLRENRKELGLEKKQRGKDEYTK